MFILLSFPFSLHFIKTCSVLFLGSFLSCFYLFIFDECIYLDLLLCLYKLSCGGYLNQIHAKYIQKKQTIESELCSDVCVYS
jgi:hypothetical protein